MKVYWKKITVWCKYPFQDIVDNRYIALSTQVKNFDTYVFMELPTSTTMEERLKYVQEVFPDAKELIKL